MAQYAVMLLAAVSVGGFVYVFASPYFNGEKKAGKRIAGLDGDRARNRQRSTPDQKRRMAVQDVLEELEQKQKEDKKLTLRHRLSRAGLSITPGRYYIYSLICAVVLAIGLLVATGGNKYVPLAGLFVGGLGLPRWYIGRRATTRQKKFIEEFANAIDIIVRGVKTGLPLNDCIGIIAQESPDPVGSEFRQIVEEQRIGIPLAQGIERMYERMPLQEVNFMAIVISIQSSAGGNLAEALSNLSTVLRERKKLKGKVKALSSEAMSSAAIIGALPVLVMGAVYLARPEYMQVLFTEKLGNILLIGGGIWMLIGVLVMKKMVNFNY